MGGEVPSGRVGKPENPDDYVAIVVGEWGRRYGTVYMPRDLWARVPPVSQEVGVYIQEHGKVKLEFDVPIGRLEV
jgi:hypothetical protein